MEKGILGNVIPALASRMIQHGAEQTGVTESVWGVDACVHACADVHVCMHAHACVDVGVWGVCHGHACASGPLRKNV